MTNRRELLRWAAKFYSLKLIWALGFLIASPVYLLYSIVLVIRKRSWRWFGVYWSWIWQDYWDRLNKK